MRGAALRYTGCKMGCPQLICSVGILFFLSLCPKCVDSNPLFSSLYEKMPTSAMQIKGKRETIAMFEHGFSAYMTHAFPRDELKPLSCQGDDGMFGGMLLTLIDSMDMFGITMNSSEFTKNLWLVVDHLEFDKDQVVSVFEINIRILGALISSHIMAMDEDLNLVFKHSSHENTNGNLSSTRVYNGELLDLAEDLGRRLLPAFETPTGIPFGSINLRYGVPSEESELTCTAGAGTFLLEFGMLSLLTGDSCFEKAARRANHALWKRRSKYNLVGAHINIRTGMWTHKDAGIGTHVDSFFEYLLKSYILFGKDEDLLMFTEGYTAIIRYLKRGPWYIEANMETANLTHPEFGSLQAFWPGLQVLYGDIEMASDTLRAFFSLCKTYDFPPDRYDIKTGTFLTGFSGYPLRPEMIESLYYLFRASNSREWIEKGLEMLESLRKKCYSKCGFAAIEDIVNGTQRDIMPSFFLAETCKYLYLLFDQNNPWHDRNIVFNTEGHPFPVGSVLKAFARQKHVVGEQTHTQNIKHDTFQHREKKSSTTSWELSRKRFSWSRNRETATNKLLSFANHKCLRPLEYNPLYTEPSALDEMKCSSEEGRYISPQSPPYSWENNNSPFDIDFNVFRNADEMFATTATQIFLSFRKYVGFAVRIMITLYPMYNGLRFLWNLLFSSRSIKKK